MCLRVLEAVRHARECAEGSDEGEMRPPRLIDGSLRVAAFFRAHPWNWVGWEWIAWLTGILGLATLTHAIVLSGTHTFGHDTVFWGYPIYHFWAETILSGHWSLWNPYTHGGEPFYPLLMQIRLLDPTDLIVLILGSRLTDDLILLFNWDRFVRGIFIALGTYLLLRRWADHGATKLSLVPALLYSSFQFASLRQNSLFDHFIWAPWTLLVACHMLEGRDYRWRWWAMLGVLLGLAAQSYYFVGTWTLFLLFLVGLLCFRRDLLVEVSRVPWVSLRIAATLCLVTIMCLPNLVVLIEKPNYVYPARAADTFRLDHGQLHVPEDLGAEQDGVSRDSIIMPYSLITQTGTWSSLWNYVQLIVPYGSKWIDPQKGWGHASEAYLYFGMLVYAGAVYGLVAGRHGLKSVWLLVGAVFSLLILGPAGVLHRVMFFLYPPLWLVRNIHSLSACVALAMLYFYVIGCNRAFAADGPLGSFGGSVVERNQGANRIPWRAGVGVGGLLVVAGIVAVWAKAPYEWVTGLLVMLCGCLVWRIRRTFGENHLFWVLVLSHVVLVLLVGRKMYWHGPLLVMLAGVPLVLVLMRRRIGLDTQGRVLSLLLICLVLDLGYYSLRVSDILGASRPDRFMEFSSRPQPPTFQSIRVLFPPCQRRAGTSVCRDPDVPYLYGDQVRYSEVLYRTRAMLPPLADYSAFHARAGSGERGQATRTESGGTLLNSFLMTKGYWSLLSGGIDLPVLKQVFAVDAPVIALKPTALFMEESGVVAHLRDLDPQHREVELTKTVLLSKRAWSGLGQRERPDPRHQETLHAHDGSESQGEGNMALGEWAVLGYRHDQLVLLTQVSRNGFLYWADGDDQYWRAFIDGAETPIYRANVNFKAVALPAGRHRVVFEYDPVWFKRAVLAFYGATAAVILAVLALAVLDRFKRKGLAACQG